MKGIGGEVTSGSGEAIAEGDGVVDIDTLEGSMAEFKIGAYDWNNTKALIKKVKFCERYWECSCGTEERYEHEHAAGAHRPRPNLSHHLAEKARQLEPCEWREDISSGDRKSG